jgi:hypothetical protein
MTADRYWHIDDVEAMIADLGGRDTLLETAGMVVR